MSAADWRFFGYPVADDALDADRPARRRRSPSSGSIGRSATRRGCGS